MSDFDTEFASFRGQKPQADGATFDDEFSAFRQTKSREQAALRSSVDAAMQTTPEQAAKVKYLSNVTGIDPSVIATQEGEVKARAKLQEIQKEAQFSPILQARLRDPEFTKLAIDDVPTLSKLEQGIGSVMQFVMGADGKGGLPGMVGRGAQKAYYGSVKGTSGVFSAAAELVAPVLDPIENVQSIGGNPLRRLAEGFGLIAAGADAKGDAIKSPYDGNIAAGAESGFTSLGQNAKYLPLTLAGPAGVAAALVGMSLETGGQSYQDARAKGLSPLQSLIYGVSDGTIEFATEKIPMHRLIGDVAANTNVFKTVAKQIGLEVPGEQIATALQDLNEWAVMNPEKTFGDYIAARPDAAIQTLVATVIGTGGNVAVSKALGTLMDAQTQKEYNDLFNAQRDAQERAAKLQDVMATAAGSKLRELSPETFREHVQAAADGQDGAPKSVHIDGQVLLQTLQSAGITEEQLAQSMPSVMSQLADAAVANSTVEIPIGELATALPGTPLEQAILPHLRIGGPDSLSQAEAEQAQEQAQEYLKGESERVMQESQDQAQWAQESEGVKTTIREQLSATGRFSDDVTSKYATLVRDFYSVMASRTGMTPKELYELLPYKVDSSGKTTGVLNSEVDALSGIVGGSTIADVRQALTAYKKGAVAAPLAPSEAKVAEGILTPMLERAAAAKPGFDATVNEVAAALGGKAKIPGLKGMDRAGQKLIRETDDGTGKPDPSQIRDLLRATVVVPRVEDIPAAIEALSGKFEVIRLKDRFAQPLPSGYRDVLMNVQLADGSMAEIQINVPAMMKAKDVGHKLYEMSRAKRDGDVEKAALEALQERLYAEAFDFAQNAASDASALAALSANASAGNGRPGETANTTEPSANLSTGTPSTSNTSAPSGTSNGNFITTSLDGSIVADANGNVLEQSATLRSGAETLAAYGLPPGGRYNTRDIAAALEARQREKWGKIEPDDRSDEAADKIAEWMAEEVRFEMQHPRKSGVGWYSYKFQRALDTFAEVFPELKKDKDARATLTALIAITSDGQKVVPNFRMAADLYRSFRETGEFTTDRGHARMDSINGNVALLQSMLKEMGPKKLREYLLQEATVSDLRKRAKAAGVDFKTDYQAHIKLPMAAVTFGPKLGAFYANLMGAHGYLTMDRWWSRTFNRYRGTLLQAPTKDGLARIKELLGHPEWSDDQAIAATVEPRNSYAAKNFKNGTELEKAANTVYKAAFENLEDAPFNASDRTFMLNAVAKAQQKLAAEGRKISVADIQAVLWYYEKRLYGELGARQTADVSYEDAAKKVVAESTSAGATGGPDALGTGPGATVNDTGAATGVSEEVVQPGLEPFTAEGVEDGTYRQSAAGNGGGRDQSGRFTPLEGAPSVPGFSGPDPRLVSVAEQYARSIGVDLKRQSQYAKVDPERAARIASAYEEMVHAPQDPVVREAFENLIRQTRAQYDALAAAGYKFWLVDINREDNQAYASTPWNAMRDIRANQSMGVFPTNEGFGSSEEFSPEANPMLADTGLQWPVGGPDGPLTPVLANDLFRAVHDAFGHGLEGAGFRAEGEENAWQAHVRLFTGSAVGAITSETRGQNSWLNYGPYGEQNRTAKVEDTKFADQKTGLMPEWTWTEGRVEDMDDGTQAEQRRMRQVMDLAVLQADTGKLNQSAQPAPQEETEAFKAWFGDSKVVGADGKPLVVYHGTKGDFSQFSKTRTGVGSTMFGTYEVERHGIFVTPVADLANDFATQGERNEQTGANVMPLYASIKNPLDMTQGYTDAIFNAVEKWGNDKELNGYRVARNLGDNWGDWMLFDEDTGQDPAFFIGMLKELGYDGVKFYEPKVAGEGASGDTFVAFEPEQIKSAIGNNGSFDASNPNILEQAPLAPGRVDIVGIHFSQQTRPVLDGRMYGTGLKGIERERIFNGTDARLRERVMFYVDEGKGVRPEAGVGGAAHSVNLSNLYDISKDPLGLIVGGNLNQTESNILDAGFDGYYVRDAFNQQGAAVVIGNASRGMQATPIANPMTKAPPLPVGPQTYKRGLTSMELTALDIDKVKAVAPTARVRSGTFMVDSAEIKAASAALASQGIQLPPQTYAQDPELPGPRGTFDPSTLTTVLNESADLSTFLHETGHFFLEAMAKLAMSPTAAPSVRADMDKLLQWFGVKDLDAWNGMTLNEKRPHHERFAESFEQYLLEGKAPNTELASLFRTFRAWLTRVYRSLKEFSAGRNLQLSDDIRQVMDRMVASEEQIAEAEKVAGLVPNLDATGEAIEQLQSRSIRDLKWAVNARNKFIKQMQQDAKAKRKEVEAEVTSEVNAMPEFAAKKALDDLRKATKEKPSDSDLAAIADAHGFNGYESMLSAIEAVGKKADVIEGMTDQRMLERYGDLVDQDSIEQAATEAVHNAARAKSLATELAAQRDLLNPRQDTGKTNAKGQKVTVNALVEAAKQFAANVIGRKAVSDLKKAAYNHLQAERRAAKAWEAATAKGDTKAAVQAKQDQMLNNAAVRAANEAQADVKKTMEFFAKVMKGNSESVVEKGRDADIVNAARAILAVYGVGTFKGKNAFEYMDLLKANDPNLFAILDDSVRAAVASAKPVGKMTVDELTALKDEIASMWHLARSSRQYEVDGDRMDIEDAAEELKVRMEAKGVPAVMPGDFGAVTEAEKRGRSLQFAGALLRRVESWAEAMDGKFGGPFLKLVFQPVKAAADRYRADRAAYRKQFTKLVENVSPSLKPGTIEAPELGYAFGKGKGGVGQAELLSAILHLGNESNKRKLLLGRNWATENEDGSLDTSRWDSFMERMHNTGVINKAHYDFAQGVWDLLEKMKPLAQKTHRDVYGRYFAEVTSNAFEVPGIGYYRGGYVPAQVDPEIVKDNEMRKLAEVENENMSYAFPATNKGFTKSRTEYNRPLMLDLRTLPQHIDKVLLFSHMEPAVRGVSKVLQQKGVGSMLSKIDPAAISGMLTPWLNRSARQIVETPIVGDGRISRVLSVVRARAGMSVMFANLSNTVQQLTGLTLARVKIERGYLLPAMAQYTRNPKKMSEAVAAASSFMATRMDDQVAALNGTVEEILLNPSVYEKAQNWTAKHTYFLQSALDNVVGPVVWSAAYNQALAKGMSEKDAVHFADGTVRQTQGSTLPEDVSRIETGPSYARIFTQFIGYFNMVANTNVTALQNIADDVGMKKGAGKALAIVFFGLLAPAWIAEAIAQGFKGGPDDEDKDGSYLDDWLKAVFGLGTVKTLLAGVPFVGQFAMAGLNTWNGKPYDDRTSLSPAVSMLEGAVGAPHSVYKALVENGSKQKAVRDVATAISMVTGLPVSAAARPLGYLTGVAEDKINPTGPMDAARGVVTGTASPESKR